MATNAASKSNSGKRWLDEHEERLQRMIQENNTWDDIGDALGRTPSACKARLKMIQARPKNLQQSETGNARQLVSGMHRLSITKEKTAPTTDRGTPMTTKPRPTTIPEKIAPWSSADELLLVQLRAIKMPYKDIAGMLSVQRDTGSISSYYKTLKEQRIGFLDDYYQKIGHPYASARRSPTTRITDPDESNGVPEKRQHDSKKVEITLKQVDDIAGGVENLRLKYSADHQQMRVSPKPCHYCHRPSTTTSLFHQHVCLQCNSALKHYTPDILTRFAHSIKTTPNIPGDHIPIDEKDYDYVFDIEYERYKTIKVPQKIQGGIKIERSRAVAGTFLNIATRHGRLDSYTNIEGFWILQHDSWDHLQFAYFKNEQGRVCLKPALSIIAHLANSSTEEDIMEWIGALKSI